MNNVLNQISNWNGNNCNGTRKSKTSIFFEYDDQIFQMILFNVKMTNGTSSSPVTDLNKQVV